MIEGSDDETAFPVAVGQTCESLRGMSLLDWFAGQALAGMMSSQDVIEDWNEDRVASMCYYHAKAMMEERAKRAKRSE